MIPAIPDPTQKLFKDGVWTYDGTVWRPQNQLLAYRDTVRELVYVADSAAGTNALNTTVVPAGEVHIITSMVAYNGTTAASQVILGAVLAGTAYTIDFTLYDALTRLSRVYVPTVLKATENIRATFLACVLNDDLYLYINGYKFKIAE